MSEFTWTDALWKEYEDLAYKRLKDHYPLRMFFELLEEFKKSKQQSKNNQDWEILSFKNKDGGKLYVGKNIYGKWHIYDNELGKNFNRDEDWMIKNGYPIESVKVLSSGEIFSLGDYCINERYIKGSGYPNKPIKRFFIHDNNNLYIQFDEGNGGDDGCLPICFVA